ncbi:MAG: RluA family pseudouridine synthase [Synergistaceae bacterium]|nr:RluA family pseudouridine synthase [Synergistaceae bacterium]
MPTLSNTWENKGPRPETETIGTEAGEPDTVSNEIGINDELAGHRLDFAISVALGVSRSHSADLIKRGLVVPADGRRVKPSLKTGLGEKYAVMMPPPQKLDLEPEEVSFGVVYADDDIIVIDKPAGLVVHPAPGHYRGTLVHGLLYRFPDFGNVKGVIRPGIVHRLDATTSGLMVVARGGFALEKLYNEFKARRVEKTYLFLCHGKPREASARIDAPVGRGADGRKMTVRADGRGAVTEYEVLWSDGEYSFAKCSLHTGRMHQIRVHMSALGCPLVGDTLYAPSRESPFASGRVFLHSWKLSFAHPRDGRRVSFRSFIPEELARCLFAVRSRASATNPR